MKKKIFCLIITLAMLLQFFAISAGADMPPMNFNLSSASGQAGDTVSLSLSMTSTVDADTYAIARFQYDNTALEFVRFEHKGTVVSDAFYSAIDNNLGTVVFMYRPAATVSGNLCDVVFSIKDQAAAGVYEVSYEASAKLDGSYIANIQSNAGQITVESSHVHNYQPVVTLPTCTTEGFTTYTCDCGESYTDDPVAALGHDLTETTVEATCTADGSITETCSRCDYEEVTPISALGHDYAAAVTAPTCTEAGYTTYTCSRCDDTYTDDILPAQGHSYAVSRWDWVAAADAYTVTAICNCTVCGEDEQSIPATVTTSEAFEGYITYNASVVLNGTEYSTIKMDKAAYTLDVTNGTIVSGFREDGLYQYSDLVAVQAQAAAQGMFFSGWYLNDKKVSNNSTYRFYIKSDSVLEAHYEDAPAETEPLVTLEITDRIVLNNKQQFKLIVRWELPDGFRPVNAGVIRGYNVQDPAVLRIENVKGNEIKSNSVAAVANTGSYTVNLSLTPASAGKDLSAVAYLECINASGEHKIIYTDAQTSAAK